MWLMVSNLPCDSTVAPNLGEQNAAQMEEGDASSENKKAASDSSIARRLFFMSASFSYLRPWGRRYWLLVGHFNCESSIAPILGDQNAALDGGKKHALNSIVQNKKRKKQPSDLETETPKSRPKKPTGKEHDGTHPMITRNSNKRRG